MPDEAVVFGWGLAQRSARRCSEPRSIPFEAGFRPVSGREPADATFNVAAGEGDAAPPFRSPSVPRYCPAPVAPAPMWDSHRTGTFRAGHRESSAPIDTELLAVCQWNAATAPIAKGLGRRSGRPSAFGAAVPLTRDPVAEPLARAVGRACGVRLDF